MKVKLFLTLSNAVEETKMMDVKTLFLLLLFCSLSSSAKHDLKFFLTGSHGLPDFPDFVASGTVDGEQLEGIDSFMKWAIQQPDLKTGLLNHALSYLEGFSGRIPEMLNHLEDGIEDLKHFLHESQGVHVLQVMGSIKWDEATREIDGLFQFGYNGKDFIDLDLQSMTWTAKNLLASFFAEKLNSDKAEFNRLKFLNTAKVLSLLNKLLMYVPSFPQRTELPSVSLLQKTSSSPITCHATGFYPNNAMLFWRKDGEELQEEVDHRDILHNPDGTFQMSVDLKLPSESSSDWGRYECVFQLSGVKEDMVTKLDKAAIRRNEGHQQAKGEPSQSEEKVEL